MDQLDRRGKRQHPVRRPIHGLGGCEREHRPDPLRRRQQRVAHRLLQSRYRGLGGEAQGLQVLLDLEPQMIGVGGGESGARH